MGEGKKRGTSYLKAPYCQEVNVLEMSTQAREASFECVFPGFVLVEIAHWISLIESSKQLHLPPNPSGYVLECLKY